MTKDASQVRELNQQDLPSISLASYSLMMVHSCFEGETEMEKAAQIIYIHIKKFGLQMHTGSKEA